MKTACSESLCQTVKNIGSMKTKHMILMALVVAMTSCVKTKNYYVNDNNRVWFADSTNCNFTMRDDNGVSYSYRFEPARQSMLETGTEILFITTEKALHEHLYQSGASSYYNQGLMMNTSLTAYKHDEEFEGCDDFKLSIGEASYTMRIDGDTFHPRNCHDWEGNVTMDFTAEYLDSYIVREKSYQGVMHLKVVDVAYPQSRFFPTEVYYAKHYGLVQITLDDRLTLYRLPD